MVIGALIRAFVSSGLNICVNKYTFMMVTSTYDVIALTRTISNNHVGCTGLRIEWMLAFVVDRCDCHRIDTIRVPVEITLVIVVATITAGKDENGAFAITTVIDSV
jgi:hypothetical protein